MRRMIFSSVLLLCMLAGVLPALAVEKSCPMVPIVPERLPDLTMPRSGHCLFYAGGELTLVGGHTTNFVPTPTAEYFAGSKWHQMTMAYTHDNGFAVAMPSGEVIMGGGHTEPLGIGQTFMVERYHPQTHTFEGFGCLDRRRVLAKATLMDDGRVIIAGNHYAADAIACYDGRSQVQHVKDVVQGRSNPYILRMANNDAIILSAYDVYDNRPDTIWADRIAGDAFRIPLLEQWKLVYTDHPHSSDICSIGDFTYLLTATDEKGQMGIVMVRDTTFSLLPTDCPIPMRCQWGAIDYKGPVVVNRERQLGYVIGVDSLYHRQYVLAIDYAQRPAALTLYYTDSIETANNTIPVMTPDGDLILAGGIHNDNYKPLSAVWLYRFATSPQTAATQWPVWQWAAIVLAAITAITIYAHLLYIRRKKRIVGEASKLCNVVGEASELCTTEAEASKPSDATSFKNTELMDSICHLMEEELLYLQSDLKLQDLAVRLGTNSSYVSECINSGRGQSFSQFVNTYRVRYAQELLRQHPDVKTAAVATQSGFSTEASFFRNFKAITGMTPREWLSR